MRRALRTQTVERLLDDVVARLSHRWRLRRQAAIAMQVETLRLRLMPTPKARPVQAAGLLILRLTHRLE